MKQTQQQTIVTFQESPRVVHYHLRRDGCGRLRPLSDAEARRLRLLGVAIELPETAVLRSPEGGRDTAV